MTDLTPESLAELRRLLDAASPRPWVGLKDRKGRAGVWRDDTPPFITELLRVVDEGQPVDAALIVAAVNALPALLDAAAFLDEVRAQVARGALCPMCSTGMTRQTVGMVCQLCGTDYARPEYASLRRDSEQASKAMLSGRCLAGITHRDEEHRQSVCMLPKDHAPLAHDDCMGCTWTDAEHWEPSAIDALAAKVEDLECVLAGAGVCVECYANGWHKLDCSRRRTAHALELPKPPTGHMVGGLITEGHAGQRLHADRPQS